MALRRQIDIPILNSVLLMCEQLQDALPHQNDPEYYITPVIRWMTVEWKRIKRIIANNIVAVASVEKVGVSADEIFDAEDSVDDGGMSGEEEEVVELPEQARLLLEARKPKLGKLGIGQIRDAKGKLVDVSFDLLGKSEFADMQAHWDDIPFESSFGAMAEGRYKNLNMTGLVVKDAKGNVQGACLFVKRKKEVSIDFIATNPANIGKKGLSGVGSNLMGRVALEVPIGGKLTTTATPAARGFYDKIGMNNLGGGMFEFTSDQAQSFAEKIGVSKTAEKAIRKETQAVVFNPVRKNAMYQQLRAVMKKYKVDTKSKIKDAKRLARSDTIPKLMVGEPANRVQVMLSKQGLEEVVKGFKFQEDFIDDLTKSTRKRVSALLKGRYGDTASFRAQVNREFRIDRDATLADFHTAVRGHAESMKAGRITTDSFKSKMEKTIHTHYAKLYREGKGSPLEPWEKDFIKTQAESQSKYLNNFGDYITQQQALGKDLTGRVTQRAALYAERGTSLFEAGHVSSLPDDILMDWLLQPAEHCPTCPIFAGNSPYTKGTLPGYPGEGFHLTKCGTNCRCILRPSDLYVTKLPEPSGKELAIQIVPPEPVSSEKEPQRPSKNVVKYKGTTYTRTGNMVTIIDDASGKQRRVHIMGAGDEVRGFFGEKPMVKKVVKPKVVEPPKVVKPKVEPVVAKPKTATVGDKTYKHVGTEIIEIDASTGEEYAVDVDEAPGDILELFGLKRKVVTPKVPKTQVAKKVVSKPPKPTPKLRKPKPVEPEIVTAARAEEIRKAMGKSKYTEPEDVRKQIGELLTGSEDLRERMKKEADELRPKMMVFHERKKKEGRKVYDDPKYLEMEARMKYIHANMYKKHPQADDLVKGLVRAEKKPFKVNSSVVTQGIEEVDMSDAEAALFKRKVETGLKEFSTMVDKDLFESRTQYKTVKLQPAPKGRASYKGEGIVAVDVKAEAEDIVHEMGHYIEDTVPGVQEQMMGFYKSRTVGEKAISMNEAQKTTGYGFMEFTKVDKFIHPYMGRSYMDEKSTELLSMGLGMMYTEPYKLASKDPELFDLIYRIVRGMPTGYGAQPK